MWVQAHTMAAWYGEGTTPASALSSDRLFSCSEGRWKGLGRPTPGPERGSGSARLADASCQQWRRVPEPP